MKLRKTLVAMMAVTALAASGGTANAWTSSTAAKRYVGCGTSVVFFSGLGGYATNRSAIDYNLTGVTVTSAASTLNSYYCSTRTGRALYTKKRDSFTFTGPTVTGITGGSGASISGSISSRTATYNRSAYTANLTNYYSNLRSTGYITRYTFRTDATWATTSNYSNAIVTSIAGADWL